MPEIVQTLYDGTARYRQVTLLDGVPFVLHFDYNTADQCWYLSVRDSEDSPIEGCESRKLAADYPVLPRVTDPNRPAGEFLVLTKDGTGNPGLYDLGDNVLLVYFTAAELS